MGRYTNMQQLTRLFIVYLLFLSSNISATSTKDVTIGIITSEEPGWRAETLVPTVQHLSRALPNINFKIVEIQPIKTDESIRLIKPQFIVASSAQFMNFVTLSGAQPLAVRKTSNSSVSFASVGSAVIVRRDSSIKTLEDLRNKIVVASLPDSLGGWLAYKGEILKTFKNPEDFINKVHFVIYEFPDLVNWILLGKADAGILTACKLEYVENSGLIEKGLFRVIGQKSNENFTCMHSTDLYPDQIFGALNFDDPELVKKINVALLDMPSRNNFSWEVPGKFDSIVQLYKLLKIGAWAEEPWSLERIIKEYKKEITFSGLLLFILIANQFYLNYQVNKRTKQLRKTLAEKEILITKENEMRNRLSHIEKITVVSQISAMIAHELKQPLATIMNYIALLNFRIDDLGISDETIENSSGAISSEIKRITEIVDRVRSHAKKSSKSHKTQSLETIVKRAINNLRAYYDSKYDVDLYSDNDFHLILCDELEIEILVINLLKNAFQATAELKDRLITIDIRSVESNVVLNISDNGPTLSDTKLEKLKTMTESTKADGLGLGLGIVRSICDSHRASFKIERNHPQGLVFSIYFLEAKDNEL